MRNGLPPLPSRGRTEREPDQPRREYLTEKEVTQLCDAARARGRWGHRDATMILMAYRHGLRVSELVALRWDQVDLNAGRLQVIRRKGSDDSVQPVGGVEIRALRRIRREQPAGARYVFLSERGALAGARPGSVVVDMTTSEPSLAREIYEQARGRQILPSGDLTWRSPGPRGRGRHLGRWPGSPLLAAPSGRRCAIR